MCEEPHRVTDYKSEEEMQKYLNLTDLLAKTRFYKDYFHWKKENFASHLVKL